jgi:3-oxoacyl-[acyl-carrier protein] reductase
MDLKLTNRRAIVCGSTQGIGKGIAFELAELGASVTLVARNKEKLEEVKNELPVPEGQMHDYLVADFSDQNTLREALQKYSKRNNEVQILINNTGGPPAGLVVEANPESFLAAFSMHLLCSQILVQSVVESMKKAGYGRIINIISTSVKEPIPGLGVSNTIRGAVASWSKTLSQELGPFGITVNNILPGSTETQRIRALISANAQKSGNTEQLVESEMKNRIPLKRFASIKEVAAVAAFLATPAAAYVNGINLPVDGGRLHSL